MHTAFVITDLTFGDAGKGSITDALARRGAGLVVRYNGGAQAAHTVIDERGKCHIFHQFGSGTLVPEVDTFLSRYCLVNPLALHYEERELHRLGVIDAFERIFVDARALVTTPYHTILNRLRELARGAQKHGSCGLGIGETAADALEFGNEVLRFGDLAHRSTLRRKLGWHRDLKRQQVASLMPLLCAQVDEDPQIDQLLAQLHSEDELDAAQEVFEYIAEQVQAPPADFLTRRMEQPGCTIFEGAQGVLLDENWGFHPHTTWSTTTPANALQLIEETQVDVQTTVLGLTRAYATRHGAGPFPTECADLTQRLFEPHNPTNAWQGPFRAGWLDISLLRYAIGASGRIDGLVVTCLDRLPEMPQVKIGIDYSIDGEKCQPSLDHPGMLTQQEGDGLLLRRAEVEYDMAPEAPLDYAQHIADRLHLPLLGTSCGPIAADKVFYL